MLHEDRIYIMWVSLKFVTWSQAIKEMDKHSFTIWFLFLLGWINNSGQHVSEFEKKTKNKKKKQKKKQVTWNLTNKTQDFLITCFNWSDPTYLSNISTHMVVEVYHITLTITTTPLVSFSLVLWHIYHCRLFNAKSIFIHVNSSISNKSVKYKYSFLFTHS